MKVRGIFLCRSYYFVNNPRSEHAVKDHQYEIICTTVDKDIACFYTWMIRLGLLTGLLALDVVFRFGG